MKEGQPAFCTVHVAPTINLTGYFPVGLSDPLFIVINEQETGGRGSIYCLPLDPSQIETDPAFPEEHLLHRKVLSLTRREVREIGG
jgi:hypothetical protein